MKFDGTDPVPKIRVMEVDIDVLLELCVSHSKLAQAEYKRNDSYNNTHFSHIAEEKMIRELDRLGLLDECFQMMGA